MMRLLLFPLSLFLIPFIASGQDTLTSPNTHAILYHAAAKQPLLVVGLGGSEGGNAWASGRWKAVREQFLAEGYAFLAVGYFGCKDTPKLLDKIAIDDVYAAIVAAKTKLGLQNMRVAVIGGSRGGDLALLLGSYYPDINCVVGLSASHAVFPGHTQEFTTSCWTKSGAELPFIPVNDAAVPFLMQRNLRKTFEAMLTDTAAERRSLIPVERIRGAVLLMSAKGDEIIPAVEMGEKMMARMEKAGFAYPHQHLIYEGGHAEPIKHFDEVMVFLRQHFRTGSE
ncbi:acyl-CoA thioester hydrolase/BAAT C-terminal domain-containing protein [Chitinophaga deserti]|uniref:acyl-CoA thioester hydrolase/BAAT C-terminal domain-containing protein n=1 Tax=Chitinophaga deserti TaxID=2164099 RepID=UPI000D6B6F5D|nr:acyl-CoA thioester hydrolase/BAAT C-terminal domain-containing protein [Chitinophaga deserti]